MLRVEHFDLFKPPAGTTAVVLPVTAEYEPAPPATYRTPLTGVAKFAAQRWAALPVVVGVLNWRVGGTPHPLTMPRAGEHGARIHLPGKNKGLPPTFHLVSLPIARAAGVPFDADYVVRNLRALKKLCDEKAAWLKEGSIVLPPLRYGALDLAPLAADWLDDRYVMISGTRAA